MNFLVGYNTNQYSIIITNKSTNNATKMYYIDRIGFIAGKGNMKLVDEMYSQLTECEVTTFRADALRAFKTAVNVAYEDSVNNQYDRDALINSTLLLSWCDNNNQLRAYSASIKKGYDNIEKEQFFYVINNSYKRNLLEIGSNIYLSNIINMLIDDLIRREEFKTDLTQCLCIGIIEKTNCAPIYYEGTFEELNNKFKNNQNIDNQFITYQNELMPKITRKSKCNVESSENCYIILANNEIISKDCGIDGNSYPYTQSEAKEKCKKIKDAQYINIGNDLKNSYCIHDKFTFQMMVQDWITEFMDNNINGFRLPLVVNEDKDYFPAMCSKLDEYYLYLSNKIAFKYEKELLQNIQLNISRIKSAIEYTYNGDTSRAKQCIIDILKPFQNDNTEFIISEVDKCYAFRGVSNIESLKTDGVSYLDDASYNLTFFKARTGKVSNFNEMFHIPLDQRGIVSTQRFSMAGIPCIYLGTTSYVCWLELDKPSDNNFSVSSYSLTDIGKNRRILNLVISEGFINGVFDRGKDKKNKICEEVQHQALQLWPLVCATSYSVRNKNRSFKSEYIISQLIMQSLRELNLDGVAYMSKKVDSDMEFPQCVNLAIPVFDSKCENSVYGNCCSWFSVTDPYNLSYFTKIKNPSISAESYVNYIYSNGYHSNICYEKDRIKYSDLIFSDFDNFLVSREHYNLDE